MGIVVPEPLPTPDIPIGVDCAPVLNPTPGACSENLVCCDNNSFVSASALVDMHQWVPLRLEVGGQLTGRMVVGRHSRPQLCPGNSCPVRLASVRGILVVVWVYVHPKARIHLVLITPRKYQ